MSNIVEFPRVNGAEASARTMPGLTTPELRARAIANFYTDERRKHVPADIAWERSEAFGRDLERIAKILAES
jgi:hypothetical protein